MCTDNKDEPIGEYHRGGNMQKYFKASIFLLLTAVFLDVACRHPTTVADPIYTVSFDLNGGGGGLLLTPKRLQKTTKLQNPPIHLHAAIISFNIGQRVRTAQHITLTSR